MFHIFLVLLWRHYVSRTKKTINIFNTIFEYCMCILPLVVLFFLRESFTVKTEPPKDNGTVIVKMSDPIMIDRLFAPQRILFSPNTDSTRTIMSSVAQKLKLRVVDKPPETRSRGVYAYKDDMEAYLFSINMTHDDALVIFHNTNENFLPSKLNYTIRIKENYMTHVTDAQDDADRQMMHAPHQYFGSIYEPFVHLQWAIDSSFIEALTGTPIEQKVRVQELPYSESNKAESDVIMGVVMVTFLLGLCFNYVLDKQVYRLIEERALGIRVLVQNVGVSSLQLGITHFINVLPAGLIGALVATIILRQGPNPILGGVDWYLIFVTVLIYFSTLMALAFVINFATNDLGTASYIGSICQLISLAVAAFSQKIALKALVPLTGLLPHVPAIWVWKSLFRSQAEGAAIDLNRRYEDNSESVILAWIMFGIQIAYLSLASWYLYRVKPGPFGIAEPWDFLFKAEFWGKKKVEPQQESLVEEETDDNPPEEKYFEPPNKSLEVGIKVVNVSKIYKSLGATSNKVLKNVNLDIYKGEITVLLGHNGAGKTTLMNIITGMTSASEGDVYVNGKHTAHEAAAVRNDIGLCPQHNVFWKEMSVLHHVMFFTLIKTPSWAKARADSLKLLNDLNIGDKADSSPEDLSGGMKRRLQLACALTGACSVLALDEPTSGLDVETRRELWDLLLKLRGRRTVLLTTHYMEEADALGDRAAALHAGRLRCCATPMFLKRAIGSGYRLTILTDGPPREAEITALLSEHVAAALTDTSLNTLEYSIPSADSSRLPGMFAALETARAALGVENVGIGASTLEAVFLKLCSDIETNLPADQGTKVSIEPQYPMYSGLSLTLRQLWALFVRQMKYTKSNLIMTLIVNIFLPFLIIGLFCYSSNNTGTEPEKVKENPSRRMSIAGYTHDWKAPYNIEGEVDQAMFRTSGPGRFWRSRDVLGEIVNGTLDGKTKYEDTLIGLEINSTDATAFYTTGVRHAAPAAVNALSNIIAAQRLRSSSDEPIITTYNHPLEGALQFRAEQKIIQPKNLIHVQILMLLVLVLHLSCLFAAGLPAAERASGSRHLHVMAGASPVLCWAATLLYHMALYCVVFVPLFMILLICFDTDSTYTGSFVVVLFVLLVLNGLAFFTHAYIFASLFSHKITITIMIMCILFMGSLAPPITVTLRLMQMGGPSEDTHFLYTLFSYIGQISPHMHANLGVLTAGVTARLNAFCALNRHQCPNLPIAEPGFDLQACCGSDSDMISYWSFHTLAPLINIIALIVITIVQVIILLLVDSPWLYRQLERLKTNKQPAAPAYDDSQARQEKEHVDRTMPLVRKHAVIEDEMLVSDLQKQFAPCRGKRVLAVKGVSFSVKKGECFGLLGANGAGKSTVFKMMTALTAPSRGDIYCGGKFLSSQTSQYITRLGYCPQFGGADAFLRGRDNVALLLALRGHRPRDAARLADQWLSAMGLERYANREVSKYSGGCARRLSCVLALCPHANVTLLDEPSAGVDPAARRRMWAALPAARALVVTSHSMDEMEALCSRLAIMCGGAVRALGAPRQVRAQHARGHSLRLSLVASAADNPDEVERLKAAILSRYNCELKDKHATMLNFHINEKMLYSVLFTQMEALKEEFSIIEDYGVSETTLEEVFIAFAKEAREAALAEEEAEKTRRTNRTRK